MIKNILILAIVTFFFAACSSNNPYINKNYKNRGSFFSDDNHFDTIDKAAKGIADQLLFNIPRGYHKSNKYVITTFVNLNNFAKTSDFGRVLGESLINELHTRRFKIIDFRAKESILVNPDGEFSLTRDVLKLKDEMPEALVVLGTYSSIGDNQVIINVRIVNNFTSDVISTAEVIYKYKNCKKFNLCPAVVKKPPVKVKTISVLKDEK